MSATISEMVASAQAEEAAEATPAVPVAEPTPEAAPPPETPPAAAEPEMEPAADPPKPEPASRRIAVLTSRLATQAELLTRAEAERDAAKALLDAAKTPAEAPKPAPGETVEQAAARLVAERDFNAKRVSLVAAGSKELGKEAWDEKTGFLHDMGATTNQAFMQTLVDLPGATKIVAQLADDPDALTALLAKPATAMAAEMGRMSAEVTRAPVAPRLSNAPRPQAPVQPAAVVAEPAIDDEAYWSKRPMKEWVAAMDKYEAQRRAGRRRA